MPSVIILAFLIILFFLLSLVIKLIDLPTKRKIKKAKDAESAIKYRKRLLRRRKITYKVLVLILLLFWGSCLQVSISDLFPILIKEPNLLGTVFLWWIFIFPLVLGFLYLKATKKYLKIQGRVSTVSASKFLSENERFVLFLRGFESDYYSHKGIGDADFSEENLLGVVKKGLGIPMCAIGMTKEADCPIGCKRIYANDETWKDSVIALMQKAERIVYLVNDRDNCVWEIEQARGVMDKCSFIVDEWEKYEHVQKALDGVLDLPVLTPARKAELAGSFYITPDRRLQAFNGLAGDYCDILGLNRNAVSKQEMKGDKPFYKNPFYIVIAICLLFDVIKYILYLMEQ